MDWDNDIANQLPAPRDDEPSSLRQDIFDELSDHLQSSLLREQHKTTNETEARQNVLDRFGNPASIAYQLWFDALKEKIMSQRITLIFSALTAIACFVAVGLFWNVMNKSQQINLAILEQLNSTTNVNAKPSEWNALKVKLLQEHAGVNPPEGFDIALRGNIFGSKDGDVIIVHKTTSKEGIADFGVLLNGSYELLITSPSGERMMKKLVLFSGSAEPLELSCPATRQEEAEFTVGVKMPEDIKKEGFWIVCDFFKLPHKIGKNNWYSDSAYKQIIISPEGLLFESMFNDQEGEFATLVVKPNGVTSCEEIALKSMKKIRWSPGEYALQQINLSKPFNESYELIYIEDASNQNLEPFNSYEYQEPQINEKQPPKSFEAQQFRCGGGAFFGGQGNGGGGMFSVSSSLVKAPPDMLPSPIFHLKNITENHLEVILPKELITETREMIKEAKKREADRKNKTKLQKIPK